MAASLQSLHDGSTLSLQRQRIFKVCTTAARWVHTAANGVCNSSESIWSTKAATGSATAANRQSLHDGSTVGLQAVNLQSLHERQHVGSAKQRIFNVCMNGSTLVLQAAKFQVRTNGSKQSLQSSES
jgi:hypothetical protein